MNAPNPSDPRGCGRLLENIMHFARVLRAAGLPIGPGKVIDAVRAVEAAGLGRRDDFYWALHAVFVNRREQKELFNQAFHIFWRNPRILERLMSLLPPAATGPADRGGEAETASRRLAEAFFPLRPDIPVREPDGRETEIDAAFTYSHRELLRHMDFESMTTEEIARAKAAIARMRLPIMKVPTRRDAPHPRGRRIDMRATLRASLRFGGGIIPLRRRKRQTRHPPLVILCDISGSMSRYSRMFLHFMHAITNDRDRVHTFVFGTRLTNITRHLRHKDVDVALEKVSRAVKDWSGGTRIGACVGAFNRDWSRRVLGQGAVVVLLSDGLDRDAGEGLESGMERLHKSCRRLIWLNPLLRYEGFEPKSRGIKAILPHVDDFRPVHDLESLQDLTEVLSWQGPRAEEGMTQWREAAA